MWPYPIFAQGIIACRISALHEKGLILFTGLTETDTFRSVNWLCILGEFKSTCIVFLVETCVFSISSEFDRRVFNTHVLSSPSEFAILTHNMGCKEVVVPIFSYQLTIASMASEHYSIKLEVFNIMCHQLMLPMATMMVVPVPVRPVNKTRPFSRGALILQVIMFLCENRVWPCETTSIHG